MIDYNETRGISKETLNELLQELNPDFYKKITRYTTRNIKVCKKKSKSIHI